LGDICEFSDFFFLKKVAEIRNNFHSFSGFFLQELVFLYRETIMSSKTGYLGILLVNIPHIYEPLLGEFCLLGYNAI
jgi:hypothetical protein